MDGGAAKSCQIVAKKEDELELDREGKKEEKA